MTDVSNRTREKTPGKEGRFATETKQEPGFALPVQAEPVLNGSTLRFAKRLHGTYDADSTDGYYDAMADVFKAAEVVAVVTAEDAQMDAESDAVWGLSQKTKIPARELRDFYDTVKHTRPGTREWADALAIDPPGPGIDDEDCVWLFEDLTSRVTEAAEQKRLERRASLLAARAQIEAELATLEESAYA